MSDGTLSVRQRQQKASESGLDLASALTSGTYETFLGGTLPSLGQGRVKAKTKSKPLGDADELRIESRRAPRLREYDRLLKSFKYSAALDAVLRKVRCLTSLISPWSHFSREHSTVDNVFIDTRAHSPRWPP